MKAWTISVTVICLVMVTCALIIPASAENADYGEFYPRLTVVVETNQIDTARIVWCEDQNGDIWGFFDPDNEWSVGDIANLLMWNTGDRMEDNEIVEVYWMGYTEDIDEFFQIMGWRE